MDLILDLFQSGEADHVKEISTFELAFKTDIEQLEKDSMLALQKFKTTRKAPEGDVLNCWKESRLPDLACDDTLVALAAQSAYSPVLALCHQVQRKTVITSLTLSYF